MKWNCMAWTVKYILANSLPVLLKCEVNHHAPKPFSLIFNKSSLKFLIYKT